MYSQKNNAANVCLTYEARTPNPKFWCAAFCLLTGFASGFIEKIFPVNLTSFFRNTRPLYSLTGAFGTDIKTVSIQLFLKQIANFGRKKYQVIFKEIKRPIHDLSNWDGMLLRYGSAN